MVATQMAATALAFFVLACEYFWPGHHFSSLAMVLIAWPAVVTQWRRRPTASSGTWLW
jgi:hypothetical protein